MLNAGEERSNGVMMLLIKHNLLCGMRERTRGDLLFAGRQIVSIFFTDVVI